MVEEGEVMSNVVRNDGNIAADSNRINDLEAWNTIVGEPDPGVYVDISVRGDGKNWETTIGFAVKRPHWHGTKYFSILGSYEKSYEAEREAVLIALSLFPTLTVYCDHPDAVFALKHPTLRVKYVPRERNRKAHYAARNRINFYNRRWDHGIPNQHEIQSHVQRLSAVQSSSRR